MAGLSSSFKSEESNYMSSKTMEEYALSYAEADYLDPGEQVPMEFMTSGGEVQVSENTYPWMELKWTEMLIFLLPDCQQEYQMGDPAVHMSVDKEVIRKAKGRFNTPVEFWVCTNYPIYHAERFHNYIKYPNKRDPDVAE